LEPKLAGLLKQIHSGEADSAGLGKFLNRRARHRGRGIARKRIGKSGRNQASTLGWALSCHCNGRNITEAGRVDKGDKNTGR